MIMKKRKGLLGKNCYFLNKDFFRVIMAIIDGFYFDLKNTQLPSNSSIVKNNEEEIAENDKNIEEINKDNDDAEFYLSEEDKKIKILSIVIQKILPKLKQCLCPKVS